MGLHDFLLLKGLKYTSDAGLELVDKLLGFIKNQAYITSTNLAAEKGSFPLYDGNKFQKSGFIKTLKPSVRSAIKERGIRNCSLLTIPPTGTTSILSGTTGGIEPMFAAGIKRKYRDGDDLKEEILIHPLFKSFIQQGKSVKHFQGAHDIKIEDHFEMLRLCQRHLDGSASKTVNIPQGMPPKILSDLYMEYLPEIKGITVYPEGSRENQPLSALSLEDAIKYAKEPIEEEAIVDKGCRSGQCDL
jgi:ribonucleoside-diphosphate reductase alpha chain